MRKVKRMRMWMMWMMEMKIWMIKGIGVVSWIGNFTRMIYVIIDLYYFEMIGIPNNLVYCSRSQLMFVPLCHLISRKLDHNAYVI